MNPKKKIITEAFVFGSIFSILTIAISGADFLRAILSSVVVTTIYVLIMNWPFTKKNA
jgi:hypothetical protein